MLTNWCSVHLSLVSQRSWQHYSVTTSQTSETYDVSCSTISGSSGQPSAIPLLSSYSQFSTNRADLCARRPEHAFAPYFRHCVRQRSAFLYPSAEGPRFWPSILDNIKFQYSKIVIVPIACLSTMNRDVSFVRISFNYFGPFWTRWIRACILVQTTPIHVRLMFVYRFV